MTNLWVFLFSSVTSKRISFLLSSCRGNLLIIFKILINLKSLKYESSYWESGTDNIEEYETAFNVFIIKIEVRL